jgi:8-oxo-dGTP diphosphatase
MTQDTRFRPRAAVYFLLIKDEKILLLRRFNTGWNDGNYSLAAGHIDGNEPAEVAMIREAREELGITVELEDLEFAHVSHRYASDCEYVDFYFTASRWQGEPYNAEPNKCDDVAWYPLDALPENVIPNVKEVLEQYANKRPYSIFGWETAPKKGA